MIINDKRKKKLRIDLTEFRPGDLAIDTNLGNVYIIAKYIESQSVGYQETIDVDCFALINLKTMVIRSTTNHIKDLFAGTNLAALVRVPARQVSLTIEDR